ncbi:MAG: ABC transporter substrate-binding protein [Betaproteobacteria bacterium]|nr:ABC transporter substrate-binding protein [Betaproteobacteria bacterium]MBI3053743.1 ABC transporter substrate-binding protein [Betaproteobacteria bacterium]
MKLSRFLLGLAAGATALTGFAAQTPVSGGVLKFAVSAEPPNYDCHAQTSFAFIHPVRPHYNTLLKFDTAKYPAIKGDLAESWTVAKDGLTYTFKLRKGVKFHDGSAFSSQDIKATYDRLRAPPAGVRSVRQASYADVASIETPDPLTVVFRLKKQNASMLTNFASPWDCVYSAAKLKQDPKFPERNVMGTGPFTFVEHVAGSQWIGRKFEGYFEKGKPYLNGYVAIFISGAPMVNALAAGEVLAEFRGQSPADRDRLVKTLGDKAVVQETPWVCSLVVTFNTKKKPFDDQRVRKALSLAIDRWAGAQALQKIALVRHVGGVLRPGYDLAASEKELVQYPGWSKDINASRAEARKLLQAAGVPNLTFTFTNRNVAMPYVPVGVFLIDQWRQIGVNVKHEQLETRLYLAAQQRDNPTYDAALDFNCDFMDEPNLQLQKYLSHDRSAINYAQQTDRVLDDLFDKQSGELDKKKRYAILREFEKRALDQAYTVPTIWWHRIIVHHKSMKGWHITPSHYVGQDLADVWLDR